MGLSFNRFKMFISSSGHLYLISAHRGRSAESMLIFGKVMQTILRAEWVCAYIFRSKSSSYQRRSCSCGVKQMQLSSVLLRSIAVYLPFFICFTAGVNKGSWSTELENKRIPQVADVGKSFKVRARRVSVSEKKKKKKASNRTVSENERGVHVMFLSDMTSCPLETRFISG